MYITDSNRIKNANKISYNFTFNGEARNRKLLQFQNLYILDSLPKLRILLFTRWQKSKISIYISLIMENWKLILIQLLIF